MDLSYCVAEQMGADASLSEWHSLGLVCRASWADVGKKFGAWMRAQPAGSSFGVSRLGDAEKAFLMRHVDGRYMSAADGEEQG